MGGDPRPDVARVEDLHDEVPVDPRTVASGGWKRALVGLVVGVVAGAAIGLLVPRDEERRRGAVVTAGQR